LSAEANALNVIAQGQVNLQYKKEGMDSKMSGGPDKGGWEKALKSGTEALKVSRELNDEEHGKLFTATALCTLAEIWLAKRSGDDALQNANEAVALFMEGGDESSAGHAWVLCAQADILKEDYNQARDDAGEGLEIFKINDDQRGQTYAQGVLDLVEKLAPAPTAPTMDPAMMAMMMAQMSGGGGGGGGVGAAPPRMPMPQASGQMMAQPMEMPDMGDGHVAKLGAATAIDVKSGLSAEAIGEKIKEVAMNIIGDEEDIEIDTPLMQAGLTSNTAVILRDEMSTTIPGIKLPPTLMFDYPSISAIADFIVERAKG